MSHYKELKKITTNTLIEMKQAGVNISMLTAYDYTFAQIVDGAGIDVILVGDSASNVMARAARGTLAGLGADFCVQLRDRHTRSSPLDDAPVRHCTGSLAGRGSSADVRRPGPSWKRVVWSTGDGESMPCAALRREALSGREHVALGAIDLLPAHGDARGQRRL